MKYTVMISEHAEADLRSIFEYIAFELQSVDNAVAQMERLEIKITELSSMPERYRHFEREPWLSRGLRIMPVDNYCVFYFCDNELKTVNITRVMYGGRNFEVEMANDLNDKSE